MPDDITESLCSLASSTLRDIIEEGGPRHGGHAEWMAHPPDFHSLAAAGHANSATRQMLFFKGLIDGEDAEKHLQQALVRSVMALYVYRKHIDGVRHGS